MSSQRNNMTAEQIAAVTNRKRNRRRGKRDKIKAKLHRYSKILHAYISAFAFLILMFFAASGLLLNHPDWFESSQSENTLIETQIPIAAVESALSNLDQETALAELLQSNLPLVGMFKSAEIFPDEEAFLKYSGAKGSSDVYINLTTGLAEYEVQKFGVVEIMNNLHIGKDSGTTWKWLIDISAILILALSLFGFFLMLFIRFRLANSLIFIGVSTAIIGGIYVLLVP